MHLDPCEETVRFLLERRITGPVVMLNLLRGMAGEASGAIRSTNAVEDCAVRQGGGMSRLS